MTLEKIKREFITFMDDVHGTYPYPRNFFGCLLSILIEQEPVSQERIMELTGSSQTTVSLTLQKIQLLLPVRTIKKVGDRKHYYTYEGSPKKFILDLMRKRVDVQDIDSTLIERTFEKVRKRASDHVAFKLFIDYLKNMRLCLSEVHSLREESAKHFEQALNTGSLDFELHDESELEKGELAGFLAALKKTSLPTDDTLSFDEEVPEDYLLLKQEYLTGIKSHLNPLYSQALANQLMVIHTVLLEGRTTQEQIQKSTLLPRSTISEVLSHSEERGFVRVSKREGSRIKVYQPAVSLTEIMLTSYDRIALYLSGLSRRLSEFIQTTQEISPKSEGTHKFLDFLKVYQRATLFTRAFSRNMKVELVKIFKDEYEKGFLFI